MGFNINIEYGCCFTVASLHVIYSNNSLAYGFVFAYLAFEYTHFYKSPIFGVRHP